MLSRLRASNPNRLEAWNAEGCREQGDTIDVPLQSRGIKMRHDGPLLGCFRLREDSQSALAEEAHSSRHSVRRLQAISSAGAETVATKTRETAKRVRTAEVSMFEVPAILVARPHEHALFQDYCVASS